MKRKVVIALQGYKEGKSSEWLSEKTGIGLDVLEGVLVELVTKRVIFKAGELYSLRK